MPDLINSIDHGGNAVLSHCGMLLENEEFKTSTVFVILYSHPVFSRYGIQRAISAIRRSSTVGSNENKIVILTTITTYFYDRSPIL